MLELISDTTNSKSTCQVTEGRNVDIWLHVVQGWVTGVSHQLLRRKHLQGDKKGSLFFTYCRFRQCTLLKRNSTKYCLFKATLWHFSCNVVITACRIIWIESNYVLHILSKFCPRSTTTIPIKLENSTFKFKDSVSNDLRMDTFTLNFL